MKKDNKKNGDIKKELLELDKLSILRNNTNISATLGGTFLTFNCC